VTDDPAARRHGRPGGVHLDARTLRGLAHPLRVRLLGLLRSDGPSTATALAGRLGLTSAATSYHLRQLAAYGFIAEEPGRGSSRERWWHAAHSSTSLSLAEVADDPGALEAGEVYLRGVAQVYAQQVQAHLDELTALPDRWRAAGSLSDVLLRLTPDEAEQLAARLQALVDEYRPADVPAADAPSDARRVTVQLLVFPRPGDAEPPSTPETERRSGLDTPGVPGGGS
jgi:DNA-binding transcriptional ArsR family regulator